MCSGDLENWCKEGGGYYFISSSLQQLCSDYLMADPLPETEARTNHHQVIDKTLA